jgi:3-oxo-4-pregnene-20-carboxyl-CoA dehydrogenase alpha subunit
MDLALPPTAEDLADAARRAILDAGGFDLTRRCVARPELRRSEASAVVDRLGLADLDVRSSAEALAAGSEVCRVAGSLAFPFPVPALLARPGVAKSGWLAAVDGAAWVEHGDLPGPWTVVEVTGRARRAVPQPSRRNRILAPFVEPMGSEGPTEEVGCADFVLVVTLDCWRILGALEAAQAMAVDHVRARQQFGRPLAEFQGVQFHVADAAVALTGLRQLARFTVWRVAEHGAAALGDALALRRFALESARTVLGISQLLHGAIGFCTEHDLSVVTTQTQAALRLPTDLARTDQLLVRTIEGEGFAGLFEETIR